MMRCDWCQRDMHDEQVRPFGNRRLCASCHRMMEQRGIPAPMPDDEKGMSEAAVWELIEQLKARHMRTEGELKGVQRDLKDTKNRVGGLERRLHGYRDDYKGHVRSIGQDMEAMRARIVDLEHGKKRRDAKAEPEKIEPYHLPVDAGELRDRFMLRGTRQIVLEGQTKEGRLIRLRVDDEGWLLVEQQHPNRGNSWTPEVMLEGSVWKVRY